MSSEQTRRVMGEYFEAVGAGDCARFFTHDICWTTIETGAQVHGPQAVQNAILGLHANMTDIRTRQLVSPRVRRTSRAATSHSPRARVPSPIASRTTSPMLKSSRCVPTARWRR